MRELPGPTFILLLAVGTLLCVTLGIDRSVISDARANGLYTILKDWQSLLSVAVALIAALIAARPVWEQLAELRVQSQQRTLEILNARGKTLNEERMVFDEVTSRIQIAVIALEANSNVTGCYYVMNLHTMDGALDLLNSATEKFIVTQGNIWGGVATNKLRREFLEEDYTFVRIYNRIVQQCKTNPNVSLQDAKLLHDQMKITFAKGQLVHDQIQLERNRLITLISDIEKKVIL